MITVPDQSGKKEPQVRSPWFCKTCQRETLHEVRSGEGATVKLCIPCLERTMMYALGQD
jgi:hypothetical protein